MNTMPLLKLQQLAEKERDTSRFENHKAEKPVFILKKTEDNRYYLQYENLPGYTDNAGLKGIIRLISTIKQSKTRQFSWNEAPEGLFIDEYPELFTSIRNTGLPLCLNEKQNILKVSRKQGRMSLEIQVKDSQKYKAVLNFTADDRTYKDIKPLNADCVIAETEIFSCRHLGLYYNTLLSMEGLIRNNDLEAYLTLFASVYPEIPLILPDYTWLPDRTGNVEQGLSFESLTSDGALQISSRWCYKELPISFLETYHPSLLIQADHERKKLTRIHLRYPESDNILKDLKTSLHHISKKSNNNDKGYTVEDNTLYVSSSLALPLLTENLRTLAGSYRLFGSQHLKKLKLKPVTPSFSFNMSSGIDFFEGQGIIELGEEELPLHKALEIYEEHGYIPLNDGSKAIIDASYFKTLKKLLNQYDRKNKTWKISLFDMPLMDQLINARISGDGMIRSREIFEGFNTIKQQALPAGTGKIKADLRDYQSDGIKWIAYLRKHGLGGCLADDMGLGKTLQAISVLSEQHRKKSSRPSLIIMPRSLLHNWEKELTKFAPHLSKTLYYGTMRNLDEALSSQIILTTYALVRNDIEELKEKKFAYLILDESQAIKNSTSRISKAVMLLNGEYRLALSGTPVENSISEIYALFRFLNPTMFGLISRFNKEFLNPIQKQGDETAARVLSARISPFILRRLKQQVAKELPDKTEQILYVDMDMKQKNAYEERRRFYEKIIKEKVAVEGVDKTRFLILQGLMELRQLASVPEAKTEGEITSAKWEILLEHLTEVIAEGHRCLIFTNFLGTIEILEDRLEEKAIPFLSMTGATRNRAELVEQFQNTEEYKVFLMTLKTGGVGLNLTGADYVYIVDPWWNQSAEQQAIDRTHRIGQNRSVFCYRLITRGTIEEKILELQEKKKEIFSSIITSDSQSLKKLSAEDIDYLLKKEI